MKTLICMMLSLFVSMSSYAGTFTFMGGATDGGYSVGADYTYDEGFILGGSYMNKVSEGTFDFDGAGGTFEAEAIEVHVGYQLDSGIRLIAGVASIDKDLNYDSSVSPDVISTRKGNDSEHSVLLGLGYDWKGTVIQVVGFDGGDGVTGAVNVGYSF